MSGYLAQFFLFFFYKKELWKTLVSEMAIFCISDLVRNLKNLLIELKSVVRQTLSDKVCLPVFELIELYL